MRNKQVTKIFEEIDLTIKDSISEKPVPLAQSKFIREYKKIKERYLNE